MASAIIQGRVARCLSLLAWIAGPAWTAEQIRTTPERYQANAVYLYRAESPVRVGEPCQNSKGVPSSQYGGR